MKKILVTGADGFIGSHLTEFLCAKGYEVKALCQYNSLGHWGWLDSTNCRDQIEVISGDIRDPFFCQLVTKGVDCVFHLAALIAIPYSYVAPQSYIETNVTGTLNMCQAALDNNVKKIIHTSTSEVYGTAQYVPIDEKHPLQPQSPYSASKIGADAIAMSYFNSFELPVAIARPFNTYGPRQSARAVIPTIISQMASGYQQIKLGDISPTRDFNYVLDTCFGLFCLMESDETIGKTINVGSNNEISIGDLFYLIKGIMGSDADLVTDTQRLRPEKSEVFRLWCDNSQIQHLTSFSPQYDLRHGLMETVKWFTQADNLKQYKADVYNV